VKHDSPVGDLRVGADARELPPKALARPQLEQGLDRLASEVLGFTAKESRRGAFASRIAPRRSVSSAAAGE